MTELKEGSEGRQQKAAERERDGGVQEIDGERNDRFSMQLAVFLKGWHIWKN